MILSSTITCPECGAGADAIDTDGFCARCGHERVAPERDHQEIVQVMQRGIPGSWVFKTLPACAKLFQRGLPT